MNSYELVFILKEDKEDQLKKIADVITSMQGAVENKTGWGKKTFAYPIKKHDAGYYYLWNFSMAPQGLKEFKKKLAYDEDIIRYLLLNLD